MQGRRLESIARGNKTYSYTYNAEGIRTSKTVNGVTREYILNGTQILGEIWSDGTTIVYIYDAEGAAIGMLYRDSSYAANKFDAFFYERNLQGDIIAVYDCEDTKLVSYTYDAWGNVSTTYLNGGDLVGAQYNPFTYRGYYRDSETGFYYLNTRYYDAVIGRFLNADSALYHSMLGYNMFAYCGNNPVNYVDYTGQFFGFIGAAISGGAALVLGFVAIVVAAPVIYEAAETFVDTVYEAGQDLVDWIEDKKEESKPSAPQTVNPPQNVTPPQNVLETGDTNSVESFANDVKQEKTYDPNPYARPGEKKQNRENRHKARKQAGWQPRNNRRDGKPAKVPPHTPSKKGHKKYFSTEKINIFEV